jgi:hypothetical protein
MAETAETFRAELVAVSRRRIARRRRGRRIALATLVAAASLLAVGAAVGAGGWLRGEPASPAVTSDFAGYAPQLGFHPEPGSAVLVARDGEIALYATTNREGGYCVAVDAPWKPAATLPDGGTCLPASLTSAPFAAGIGGAAGGTTLVVVGRTTASAARTVEFAAPDGGDVSRQLGSSGFFVAELDLHGPACAGGGWRPRFDLRDARGNRVAAFSVDLVRAARVDACVLYGLHAGSRR